jgi:dihydroorotase
LKKLTSGSKLRNKNKAIEEGGIASITLFNPQGKNVFTKSSIYQNQNSAFLGMETKGQVYGILNQGKLILA